MIGSSYEFLFAELIQRFKKNFPKATLRILDNLSHNVHDQVNKDLIDFALMTVTDHAGEPIDEKILREQYKNMSVLPLKNCYSCAMMNKNHSLSQKPILYLSDLISEQLIIGRQYAVEYFIKNLEKYPIIHIERITVQKLLDQNYGIFIDSTPLELEQCRENYPKYQIIPFVNDLVTRTSTESEWPTYLIYKEQPHNKLHQLFLAEIKDLLQNYHLFK